MCTSPLPTFGYDLISGLPQSVFEVAVKTPHSCKTLAMDHAETCTGGQAAVRSLVAHGVTDLFGVPGVQLDWFYNAIHDEGQPFTVYTARHEQGAAYMAVGYAMASGRLGVLDVVPGPGILNASAALATGHALNVPLLVISGQIPSAYIDAGHGHLHEIVDQPSLVAPFTRWRGRALSPDQVSPLLAEAITDVFTGDPRVAYLEIPPDVLKGLTESPTTSPVEPPQPVPDADSVARAVDTLANASNPMIVVGGGARDVPELVRQLAEQLHAPVVMHRNGRGVLPSSHPLAVTVPAARALWPDVDVVLAIGSRLQIQLSEWGIDDDLSQVWVNTDPEAPHRMGTPDVSVVARAEEVLPLILDGLSDRDVAAQDAASQVLAARIEDQKATSALEPQLSYLNAIRRGIGADGVLVSDLTQVGYVSRSAYDVHRPRTYFYASYMGTLGWAFPTALGAKVAVPDSPVVALVGDGGFLFTANELATAVHYGISTITIVFDDSRFGNVQIMQKDNYGGRVHATDLTNPDFVAFAQSFGAHAERVDGGPDALADRIEANLDREGPTVLVVPQGEWPNPWSYLMNRRIRGGLGE